MLLLSGMSDGKLQFVDLFLIPNMVDEHEMKLRLKAGLSPLGMPLNPVVLTSEVYPSRNQLMVKLIEVAESRGGLLTVTQGVKATGATFAEVEAVLTVPKGGSPPVAF